MGPSVNGYRRTGNGIEGDSNIHCGAPAMAAR
jgi:hypothetical protein